MTFWHYLATVVGILCLSSLTAVGLAASWAYISERHVRQAKKTLEAHGFTVDHSGNWASIGDETGSIGVYGLDKKVLAYQMLIAGGALRPHARFNPNRRPFWLS